VGEIYIMPTPSVCLLPRGVGEGGCVRSGRRIKAEKDERVIL